MYQSYCCNLAFSNMNGVAWLVCIRRRKKNLMVMLHWTNSSVTSTRMLMKICGGPWWSHSYVIFGPATTRFGSSYILCLYILTYPFACSCRWNLMALFSQPIGKMLDQRRWKGALLMVWSSRSGNTKVRTCPSFVNPGLWKLWSSNVHPFGCWAWLKSSAFCKLSVWQSSVSECCLP